MYLTLTSPAPIVQPFPLRSVPSVFQRLIPFAVLWPLLTSGRSVIHRCMGCLRIPSRPPQVRVPITFIPSSRRIYTARFGQYSRNLFSSSPAFRTSFCLANSSALQCLICGFCSSARDFASGFLQIPPHDGHPCLWLTNVNKLREN